MAPEVAMQDPYDRSADVFSYAMVLYELLVRDKPPPRKLKDAYAWDAPKMKQTIPPVRHFGPIGRLQHAHAPPHTHDAELFLFPDSGHARAPVEAAVRLCGVRAAQAT
jgi:serine/threonine protein kinase